MQQWTLPHCPTQPASQARNTCSRHPPGRVELLGRERGRRCVLRAPRAATPAPRLSCAAGSGSAATKGRRGGSLVRAGL